MSPYPPPLNPSQTVERIREIIVGRHLERLEQRVALLETSAPPHPPVTLPAADRHPPHEIPLAAIQRIVDHNRQQTELRLSQYREETQRLALQIQQVAVMKSSEAAPRAVIQLERRLGTWLTDWQSSLSVHLVERDQRVISQLRQEFAALWTSIESQLVRLESRTVDRDTLEERFSRISVAARALADSLSPIAHKSGSAAP